jgi:hypothetical protein
LAGSIATGCQLGSGREKPTASGNENKCKCFKISDSSVKETTMNHPRTYLVMALLGSIFLIAGCSTTYYTVWEQLGKEKRHLLKDNVASARDEQEQASEQFKDALTQIKELRNLGIRMTEYLQFLNS